MKNIQPSGNFFVVSAPSGAGKTSLVRELIKRVSDLCLSISHTTRAIRSNEQDGVDYHFISKNTFNEMIREKQFLEYAAVFDNLYGTSKKTVMHQLQLGYDVILEIDWQGAEQIRRQFANCISIFVLPPSKPALLQRLKIRAQNQEHEIAHRVSLASHEIAHYHSFDYLVVNDDFVSALNELEIIVRSQRLLCSRQELKYRTLLRELLC